MSNLRDRLYNQQVNPPTGVWERIASELDESHLSNEFPSKLYEMEATPPPGTWNKIEQALDNNRRPAPVIPIRQRVAGFARYAAAVVLIFLAGYFILRFSDRNEDPSAKPEIVQQQDTSSPARQGVATTDLPQPEQEVTEEIIPDENTRGSELLAARKPAKPASTQPTRRANTSRVQNEAALYASNEIPDLTDRYVMFMTPTGKIIRMSRKWGDMVCCVSGEEETEACKDQLEEWQRKLATSAASPSGNFIDLLNLVSALENGL